jgi:hypothetical protein
MLTPDMNFYYTILNSLYGGVIFNTCLSFLFFAGYLTRKKNGWLLGSGLVGMINILMLIIIIHLVAGTK